MRQGSLGGVVTRSGLILDDRYRLDERIAAGGVGQVWRATDLLLDRPVAVKVLRPEYSDHPETLERFRKEAKNAGALNNPHVAQVYDYGASGPEGSPYLVMEFVDGPSLADILVVDPIDPVRALDVIAQAAEGLAAAHKAGVIHRDIKPGNILISREGRVKVTDFGIAHAAGQVPVTSPGLVMGTTQYMAPERIAGNQGTAASDLYALGIVLHECLTGVPPHDGTAAEVMAAHLYLPLPPLPADVPAELDVLVDRLTTKDPTRRISDALELAELAARLRDSMGDGTLVPLARTAAQSGPGAAYPSPVSRSAAVAVEPAADWPGTDGAAGAGGQGGMTPNTAVLYAPGGWGGPPGYVSDDWTVPPRMSRPTVPPGPPGQGQQDQSQGNPRKRAGVVAVGAAAVASAGLVALLVSGAFSGTPAANQSPAGTATSGATGAGPSPGSSGASRTSAPASGAAGPSSAATTGATSTQAAKEPSTSPSAHPSTGSPGSPTTGGGSSTPSGGSSGSPTGPASTSPSGNSSPSPSGSPSPSACLLGICF
jgi:eukaryotic-like serine/threonine-protein kinase